MGMKRKLLETVQQFKEKGHDFVATPALFTWSYPEDPYIQFQMLIKETEEPNITLETTIH